MKKIFLILIAVFSLSNFIFGQQPIYRIGEFYEGYIINNDGTKERGYIQHLDESKRYEKVIYRKEIKAKKLKFKPKDIKGYKVAEKEYHSIQFKGLFGYELKFLIIEKEACISQYYFTIYGKDGWTTQQVFAKKDEAISGEIFITKFAKKMANFINDNVELSDKVRNKQKGYRILSIYKIIGEYNSNCEAEN